MRKLPGIENDAEPEFFWPNEQEILQMPRNKPFSVKRFLW